jgi:UDP-N-acetylmuramoyl-tripeptide--D-alanyl-D-alanine ligase
MEKAYQLFLDSSGICTDTRQITKNCFFICLKGENFDGNKFAEKAIAQGAKLAVVDNHDYHIAGQTMLVEDALLFLQELARHHRRQFSIPLIGITGSNGKTTSKELIAVVLEKKYKVHYTKGNLNNHIGVPLTLLGLEPEHEIAVIEMGANKFKDIQELCDICEPDFGLITNIGRAHLEGFGSFEGVLKTKKELYDCIQKRKGEILFNADDKILKDIIPVNIKTYTYAKKAEAGIQGRLIKMTPFVHFTYRTGDYESPEISTKLVGEYNFFNFLAALAFGLRFDVPFTDMNSAISLYTPSNNRSQVTETENNTLIVDCYNANPTSMSSALRSFILIEHDNKLAILGDMRELGAESQTEHQKILDLNRANTLSAIYVGEEFGKLVREDESHFKSTQDLIDSGMLSNLKKGLILLKGSRGIKLESTVGKL